MDIALLPGQYAAPRKGGPVTVTRFCGDDEEFTSMINGDGEHSIRSQVPRTLRRERSSAGSTCTTGAVPAVLRVATMRNDERGCTPARADGRHPVGPTFVSYQRG